LSIHPQERLNLPPNYNIGVNGLRLHLNHDVRLAEAAVSEKHVIENHDSTTDDDPMVGCHHR
jgi:hypothetical protein